MLNRAYTVLEIKAVDLEARTITGIAATPTPDRQGDIFEPTGATFAAEIPLLLHHDKQRPVGVARLQTAGSAILFEATLARIDTPGPLRDRLEETFQSLTVGLLKGVSVGFRALRDGVKTLKSGGLHFLKTEVCELSLVTIPANSEATVMTVKSADAPYLPTETKMTIADQIITGETRRATNLERMKAIVDSDTALTDEQTKEYDRLQAENTDLDARLPRLQALEKAQATAALPVTPQSTLQTPTSSLYRVNPNVEPGMRFVRYVKAWAESRGDSMRAIKAAARWTDTPEVELLVRAAAVAATTTSATYAGPLKPTLTHLAAEFIELLRPATILGRIPGLRRVPFNVSVPRQTAGGTYSWVGEGAPKPVTALTFSTVTLPMYKVAGILVFTKELAMSSDPSAETTFRDEMIAGIAGFMDSQFIDPAVTLSAGVRPASITNGVTGIAATGNPLVDIAALLNSFVTANIPLGGVVLLMSESNAFVLANRRSAMGEPDFPNMSISGGSVAGVPVITSNACGTNVIALVPRYVLYADNGGVEIDVSQEASLQMDTAPAAAPDATTVYTSLWQMNYIGLRAERFAAWIKAHASAVNMITGTAWVPNIAAAAEPPA